jgi:hypothetical protein
MKQFQKHIIHKAMLWQKLLDEGRVKSLSEIAQKEGMTRARVTQIMNLLKLPAEWQEFLAELDDPKEIRKYSERRVRNWHSSRFDQLPPSVKKKPAREPTGDVPEQARGKWKPLKIRVVEVEPLPPENLEVLKELIKRAALRKLKELEEEKE